MLKIGNKKHKLNGFIAVVSLLLFAVLFGALFSSSSTSVSAAENPYDTYGLGPNNSRIRTQAVYDPLNLIQLDVNKPQDFAVDGDKIYIADTLNKAVKVTDFKGAVIKTFGLKTEEKDGVISLISDGTFLQPTGVYIVENTLYVADKDGGRVLLLDKNTGSILQTITRPTHPLYGAQTPFKPSKVVVDTARNVYLTGEGCPNGVIHINRDGEFEGYLGVNKTPASLKSLLQSLFFSKEQQDRLLSKVPPSPTNIAVDSENLLFTLTAGTSEKSIKRLNTAGTAIKSFGNQHAVAMSVDANNNTFVVDSDCYISIFDANGWFLFEFAGKDIYDRFGMLKAPTAIRVLPNGDIMVLDMDLKGIMHYTPTLFFLKTYKAVNLSQSGFYMESEELWKEILEDNSNLILGYSTLARANMKRQNYSEALSQFKKGEDLSGYSDAFWQVRNEWTQANSLWVILAVVGVIVVIAALRLVNKYTSVLKPVTGFFGKIKKQKLVSQLLYSGHFVRHPLISIEQMKYKNKLTVLPAIILFVLYAVVSVICLFTQGYLWTGGTVYNVNLISHLITLMLPLLLVVVCNYFVSSVTSGEGKFKHVFIAMAYSLTPLIIAMPIITILSNVFTYNEMIILQVIQAAFNIVWGLLMLLSIAGVHGYGFKGIVKNLLLTVFCLLMVVLFAFIIYILFMQQFTFFATLFGEAFL